MTQKEFTLDDIEIGDMVKLKYNKDLPNWLKKKGNLGHWFFVISKEPLTVCPSSTKTDKINKHFPWNVEYHDKKPVAVKTDTPIRIDIENIKDKLKFNKNPKYVKDVLDRYNEFIRYKGER